MLCEACHDIFSEPRKLSFGTYYPWKHTPATYAASLKAGCQLCNNIEESLSYNSDTDCEFPQNTTYAFKALGHDWARYGEGQKWPAPQLSRVHDFDEMNAYTRLAETDPTPNQLGKLLATDASAAAAEAHESWLVLEFYGDHPPIVLPIEIATDDPLETIAQEHIDDQLSTSSEGVLKLARSWLLNCLDNHCACGHGETEPWVPTRLLDAGLGENPVVRLVLGSSLQGDSPYLALSHRWGAEKNHTLQSTNLAAYQQEIKTTQIPATIRDAIEVTRDLGFRYLWADSMCIIQDDPKDWLRESTAMSKVYGSAKCTIAASGSGSGDRRCFATRNPRRIRPCRIPNPFNTTSKYSFYVRSQYLGRIYNREIRDSEWHSRGWVFQERILSTRLLFFSETQILWACRVLQAAETWPCGKTTENYIDCFSSFAIEKTRFMKLMDPLHGVKEDHDTWWTFLQGYVTSQLTVASDRLIALRGIATIIENITGEKYYGGFWLNRSFPLALLWRAKRYKTTTPDEYSAPSWSWASAEGRVIPNRTCEVDGLIDAVEHTWPTDCQFTAESRVAREALRISGKLVPATLLTFNYTDKDARLIDRAVAETWMEQEKAKRAAEARVRRWTACISTSLSSKAFKIPLLVGWIAFCPAVTLFTALGISTGIYVSVGLLGVVVVLCFIMAILSEPKRFRRAARIAGARWSWEFTPRFLIKPSARKQEEAGQRWHHDQATLSRRREEADARAQRAFDDLERGIPLESHETHPDAKSPLTAIISLDQLLPQRPALNEVFCLPVIKTARRTSGLLLRRAQEKDDHYARLGIFDLASSELRKLPQSPGVDTFVLV